ncbi:MAG: hypothetical protein IK026_00835 [Eubacteriaceae bacterium]|nr:hypothetical protein [Eubacteriaceae bacterium]
MKSTTRKTDEEQTELGELLEFSYSPGYSDMAGGYHNEDLHRDENGQWVIISRDRPVFSDPTTIKTYAVTEEAVRDFLSFITEKKFLELQDREESDLFATDYSPWSFTFIFRSTSETDFRPKRYRITEYKEYSKNDRSLIQDTVKQFVAMYGELLSETTEDDR